jgi:hypothetical protein
MKHYLTFLTFGLLATTNLVHAGKNFNLTNDWNDNTKLQAKHLKLEEKIAFTLNELYSHELEKKRQIVKHLIDEHPSELSEQNKIGWQDAAQKISEIKQNRKRDFLTPELISLHDRIISAGSCFPPKSDDCEILNQASQTLWSLRSVSKNDKNRLIDAYLEQEPKIRKILLKIPQLNEESLEEAEKLACDSYIDKLGSYKLLFPKSSEEWKTLDDAIEYIAELAYYLKYKNKWEAAASFFKFKNIEEKVNKILKEGETQLNETLDAIHSVLQGKQHSVFRDIDQAADNTKDDEIKAKLTSTSESFLNLREKLNELMVLTKKYLELEQEAIQILKPVFKFNFPFGNLSGNSSSKSFSFVNDPSQAKEKRHGPKNITQTKEAGHVTIEGDGYVFYYQIPAAQMKERHGQQFKFEVEMKTTTPGAYIQYWGFKKGSEKLKSVAHRGDGEWQTLSVDFTADKEDTQYFIYPAIMPAVPSSHEAPVVEIKNARVTQL